MKYCFYIHYIHTYIHTLLYLSSDFRVAYAANISEHLTIRWEIDHHIGNYVTYSFRRALRNYLWCWVSLAFKKAHKAFFQSEVYCDMICKMKQFDVKKLFVTQAYLHVLHYMYLCMSSLCCSQKRQDHFAQSKVMCETLEPAVRTYMINTFTVNWSTSRYFLSTGLITWIGYRKEIRKLTLGALAIRRSESRNCGLCGVYIQKDGATRLVGAW